jgi:hypothetical protein
MAFELQDVVNDPDLAEAWTILRNAGQFAAGGWQGTTSSIPFWGVTTVDEATMIEMIPEADRVHGARLFISECRMNVTSEKESGTSDIIVWHGEQWRVRSVADYSNRGGFYAAQATRMRGA